MGNRRKLSAMVVKGQECKSVGRALDSKLQLRSVGTYVGKWSLQ